MAPTTAAARRPDKLDVEYEFRLEVATQSGAPYEVDVVQKVPHEKMVSVSHTVPVLVSASDPKDVVIDFESVPGAAERARAAAQAAEAGDVSGVAKALGYELADPPDENA